MSEVWLWDYNDAHKIRITDIDGDVFEGYIVVIMDGEENGLGEDDITIKVGSKYIGFRQSEVKKIEVLDDVSEDTAD